jgi:flavin reductase (DIM6/NTAB) family NADH-FMN oxidoreductase RutF
MEHTSFRDAMSLVPTSVSIIRLTPKVKNSEIVAATVSSLISVSVMEGKEEVLFALKNDSYLGQRLVQEKSFTINLLGSRQDFIAKLYGSSKPIANLLDVNHEKLWLEVEGSFHLKNSLVSLNCELSDHHVREYSTIYFGRVTESITSAIDSPLIYQNRNFQTCGEISIL